MACHPMMPTLSAGETYAGLIAGPDGQGRHVIVLPEDLPPACWDMQGKLALRRGGALPDQIEYALLRVCLPALFQRENYWSGFEHEFAHRCAWYQNFSTGSWQYADKRLPMRARIVRRVDFMLLEEQ